LFWATITEPFSSQYIGSTMWQVNMIRKTTVLDVMRRLLQVLPVAVGRVVNSLSLHEV
jgi:hypothetical protein